MVKKEYKKSLCCGCGACKSICTQNAIELIEDNEGFFYPCVNVDLCIECGKCNKVCQYEVDKCTNDNEELLVYAGWNVNNDIRNHCASGGVFYTLAKEVLRRGGVVIGAAFSDDYYNVEHLIVKNEKELNKLLRSKYVQSDTKNVFSDIKEFLDKGITVLFSGTPCQIFGLISFFGFKPKNLILCEVFCYGVPSPMVYQKYVEYLENKYSSKVVNVNFKDKRYGWDYYTTCITFASGKKIFVFGGDSYRYFMKTGYSLRPSCLHCNYNFKNSVADFTLGDFYTYKKYIDVEAPKSGINCIVVHNESANELLKSLESEILLIKVNEEAFCNGEKVIRSFDTEKRNSFFKLINSNGYNGVLSLIIKDRIKVRIRKKLISIKMLLKRS